MQNAEQDLDQGGDIYVVLKKRICRISQIVYWL